MPISQTNKHWKGTWDKKNLELHKKNKIKKLKKNILDLQINSFAQRTMPIETHSTV
jgi:hypothetical protein